METKHGRLDPFQSPEKRSLNVLLTGATGVVGSALLPSLSMHNIVCLIHSTGIRAPGVKTLYGDVRRPLLGLSRRDFADLSSTIDVIVHAAADTSFGNESALVQTNVVGTARVVELALEAEARLVHLSTAFSALGADGDAPALAYARTKANAEELVHASGVPAVIVRPSIIVSDSRTGRIAREQGFHKLLGVMIRGMLPIIPLDPARLIDFVPQDLVAKSIASALDGHTWRDQIWLTAGSRALRLAALVDETRAVLRELGRPIPPVRFVDAGVYERLIVPVFLESLPTSTRKALAFLAEQLPAYATNTPFPSDIGELPDQQITLRSAVRQWIVTTRVPPYRMPGVLE